MLRAASLILALALLVPAAGEAAELALYYERESGCPDEAAFRAAVTARAPSLLWSTEAGEGLHVRLQEGPGGFSGIAWRIRGPRIVGERSVGPAAACDQVFEALVFAISVSMLEGIEPPRTPVVPPAAAAPAGVTDGGAPVEAAAPVGLRIALGGAASVATSFGAAPGGQLEVLLRRGSFGIAFGGWAEASSVKRAFDGELRGATAAVTATGCRHAVWQVQACLTTAVGQREATAVGLPDARTVNSLFLGVGPRAELELPLTDGFAVVIQAEVLASLSQTTLQISGEPVWTSAPVAGRASISLATELGDGFWSGPQ
jgi:hypothetical protein